MQSINLRRYAPVSRTILMLVIATMVGGALSFGATGTSSAFLIPATGLDRADAITRLAGPAPAEMDLPSSDEAAVDRADAIDDIAGASMEPSVSHLMALHEMDRADAIAWLAGGR